MIGFITTSETLAIIEAGFVAAFDARNVPRYLTLGAFEIQSGEHAGKWFIPFDDSALTQPLYGNRLLTDFPEFDQLISILGGMSARVEISLPSPEL